MEIIVFGKPDCKYCKTTQEKFSTFLRRWGIEEVPLIFFDMESLDGLTEGAFYGVSKIPSSIIKNNGNILKRWDGVVPLSKEFEEIFKVASVQQ